MIVMLRTFFLLYCKFLTVRRVVANKVSYLQVLENLPGNMHLEKMYKLSLKRSVYTYYSSLYHILVGEINKQTNEVIDFKYIYT